MNEYTIYDVIKNAGDKLAEMFVRDDGYISDNDVLALKGMRELCRKLIIMNKNIEMYDNFKKSLKEE